MQDFTGVPAIADVAAIANMAPEYGATCGIFPIDAETLRYLNFTNRNGALVEQYARANMLWHDDHNPNPIFSTEIELDLSSVESSLAGPKHPQDRVALSAAKASWNRSSTSMPRPKTDQYLLPHRTIACEKGTWSSPPLPRVPIPPIPMH